MKRFKKIMSAAIAAIMCVAISAPAFATSETGDTKTETYLHNSTWVAEEAKETNKAYKLVDNVWDHATPTLVTAGDTSMMLYADATKNTVSTTISKGEDGSTSTATNYYTETAFKCAVRNNKTGKWLDGGILAASDDKHIITDAEIYTDYRDIYVVTTEMDKTFADKMLDMGDASSMLSFLTNFKMKIVINKYDVAKNSFAEAAPAISETGKIYALPKLIFNNNVISISYVAFTIPSLTELVTMLPEIMAGKDDLTNNLTPTAFLYLSSFDSVKNAWNTPKSICEINASSFFDYVPGVINNKLTFAFIGSDNDSTNDVVKVCDENGKLLYSKIGVFKTFFFDKLVDSKTECFYICDATGKLTRLDFNDSGKCTEVTVLTDIPDTEIRKTNTGIAYIANQKTLISRVFDTKTNTYADPFVIAEFDALVYSFDINIINDNNLVVVQTDSEPDPNKPADNFCGATIHYALYDGKTDDENVIPSFEKPAEPKPSAPSEKPSDTAKPADATKPADTTKPSETAKPTETTKKPASTNDKIPNTGSTSVGITAFALLGISAACVVALKKKKVE